MKKILDNTTLVAEQNAGASAKFEPRVFIVEVTHTKIYRVVVGGDSGSVRIEGEQDDDAAEALVNDYVHLPEFMLPRGLTIEREDCDIESIKEVFET